MRDRLDAAAEETVVTLFQRDEAAPAQDRRRLLLTAHTEDGGAVLEFVASTGDKENLQDRIALLGEHASGVSVERDISLRLLRHVADGVRFLDNRSRTCWSSRTRTGRRRCRYATLCCGTPPHLRTFSQTMTTLLTSSAWTAALISRRNASSLVLLAAHASRFHRYFRNASRRPLQLQRSRFSGRPKHASIPTNHRSERPPNPPSRQRRDRRRTPPC